MRLRDDHWLKSRTRLSAHTRVESKIWHKWPHLKHSNRLTRREQAGYLRSSLSFCATFLRSACWNCPPPSQSHMQPGGSDQPAAAARCSAGPVPVHRRVTAGLPQPQHRRGAAAAREPDSGEASSLVCPSGPFKPIFQAPGYSVW